MHERSNTFQSLNHEHNENPPNKKREGKTKQGPGINVFQGLREGNVNGITCHTMSTQTSNFAVDNNVM